jgi:SprB repeat/Secretion system C-terminal sorting domain
VTCNGGSNGKLTAAPSGGTAPYTYSWSPGGASTNSATGLTAGAYTVTVTDKNGCDVTAAASITQPTALGVTASVTANISCHGGSNGSVLSSPSGGVTPYTYAWSGGGSTAAKTGLTAGTYTITLKDHNGCSVTASATVTQPVALAVVATITSNVTCKGLSDGILSSAPSGGTSPYTYAWTPSGGNGATASNLSAGTYTITVDDNNGCSATASKTVTQPAAVLAITMASHTNVGCRGNFTGSATANTPTGGTAPYTYNWTPSGGNALTASSLGAGTYTITATDNHGCTATASATITQPAAGVTISIASQTNILCNGGTGSITANSAVGGVPPYTYNWTPSGGTNLVASNLSAGTYNIIVTDNSGCGETATATITQPLALTATPSVTSNVNCNGGSNGGISSNPAGGTAPYTYSWAPGGGNAAAASNLSAGTYVITLKDNHGCSTTASATITQPAAALAITTGAHINVLCNGSAAGTATANAATGGTTPYTYNWTPSGGTNLTASSLTAGSYTITATDNHGCTATATTTITQPGAIVFTQDSINQTSAVCNGQAWVTVISGGVAPYKYSWSPGGATTDTITECAGSYCCKITDNNGCSKTTCVTINNATAVENISNASSINIYPDPNTGYFTVEGIIRGQIIEMYNYLGQKFNTVIADNSTMHFDISTKANGVYLVRVINTDGSVVIERKIVKTQ